MPGNSPTVIALHGPPGSGKSTLAQALSRRLGWPLGERIWITPSPNAPNLSMARAYAGTVMLEGTTLSEGRGTTRPLELFGAPDIDARVVMKTMHELAPRWLEGCRLREASPNRPAC